MKPTLVRYRPAGYRANMAMWGIGLLVAVGAGIFVAVALLGAVPPQERGMVFWGQILMMPVLTVLMCLWLGRSGKRRGEFATTDVTVDDHGITVRAVPVENGWQMAWEDIGDTGVFRVGTRTYLAVQRTDRRDAGAQGREERLIAQVQRLDVATRTLPLEDDLRRAVEARLGPLTAWPGTR